MSNDNRTCPECGWAKSEYRWACESCIDKHNDRINREEQRRKNTSESYSYRSQSDSNSDFCTYNGQHD